MGKILIIGTPKTITVFVLKIEVWFYNALMRPKDTADVAKE